MTIVHNFTEFYNILKTRQDITNVSPRFKEFIALVETFQQICSCRGGEKNRIKVQVESQYRHLVLNEVTSNFNIFLTSLDTKKIKFLYNNALIKEFG